MEPLSFQQKVGNHVSKEHCAVAQTSRQERQGAQHTVGIDRQNMDMPKAAWPIGC
jgi:hypothetical protein